MLLMILCGITGFCSPQYFTSVSKANIVLESQFSVTALKTHLNRVVYTPKILDCIY